MNISKYISEKKFFPPPKKIKNLQTVIIQASENIYVLQLSFTILMNMSDRSGQVIK